MPHLQCSGRGGSGAGLIAFCAKSCYVAKNFGGGVSRRVGGGRSAKPTIFYCLLLFCQKVTYYLSKKSRELAPEKPRFYYFFSVYIFAARLRSASFSFSPPACFFNHDPKILHELAAKAGQKKRGPAGPAQMAAKTHTAEDSGLSVAQVCVARRHFRRASRVPAIFALIAVFDGPMSVVVSGGGF